MTGTDLLILRRDLDLTQEEAREAIGAKNRGFLVEIERTGFKLADEEFERMAAAMRTFAESRQKREGVMA